MEGSDDENEENPLIRNPREAGSYDIEEGDVEGGLLRHSWVETKKWSNCSIYKIPSNLRAIDPNAYSPQVVSIGPIHRSRARLQTMQHHKWRFLRRFLDRTQRPHEMYRDEIWKLKDRARECYSWRTEDEMDDEKFVGMLLLDACFILELFQGFKFEDDGRRRRRHEEMGYLPNDPVFGALGVLKWIQRDLLLLENQIPLFVLQRLWEITPATKDFSLVQLAVSYFESAIQGYIAGDVNVSGNQITDDLHLLSLVRQCIIKQPAAAQPMDKPQQQQQPSAARPMDKPQQQQQQLSAAQPSRIRPSVTTLRDAGVKLRKNAKRCQLTDIEFRGRVLYVPQLVVDDSFSIFLNLMALEQCLPGCSNDISIYMDFMDGLIDSAQDVAYLKRKQIVVNGLGSDMAVAELFNRSCREIVIDDRHCSRLTTLTNEVKGHLKGKWPSWKVSLKRDYCHNPWKAISVVAGVIIIILTVVQAVYSVLSFHRPCAPPPHSQ